MKRTERYLQRATLGLWGQRRADVRAELRGAVEDKLYRYQLLGLSPEAAETAALRDLGSPHRLAWSLGFVHTGTTTLRLSLLLGMAGLLSLQAVAQVATVKSAFGTERSDCRLAVPADFQTAAIQAKYARLLQAYGGPERYLQLCRAGQFEPSALLNVTDLLSALTAGGVPIRALPEATPTTPLLLLGPTGTPEISFGTVAIKGERYLNSPQVLPFLRRATTLPIQVSGLKNPIIHVGDVALQLGTSAAPVWTVDLLSAALEDARTGNASFPLPVKVRAFPSTRPLDPAAPQLAVPGQDGDVFAVVQNALWINTDGAQPETLWVRARQQGRIAFTDEVGSTFQVVSSQAELDRMTARKIKAALVYRVEARDIQHLQLHPVLKEELGIVSTPGN